MDAASCTAIRLQWTLASLLVMCTIGFIMSPAVPGILFIILIAIGLVGVRRRHVGLLKFYWTVQILFFGLDSLFIRIPTGAVLFAQGSGHI